jgi:hypothetical protein
MWQIFVGLTYINQTPVYFGIWLNWWNSFCQSFSIDGIYYQVHFSGDSEGQVVAFGTGNCCIGKEHLTCDGRCLIDSYALAMARRALIK